MNRKQIIAVWVLAAWLGFSFLYAARNVEEASPWERGKAKVSGEEEPPATVSYQFVWERDAGTFLMLAVPGLLLGVPLIFTLGRKK